MNHSLICSTGKYLPGNIIANRDLTQFPVTAAEIITRKTGIVSRRFASPDQCTSDLAIHAAQDCLGKCGIYPEALDAVIVATSSPDRVHPATATRVQQYIEADNAFAFDINSVCSGSTYGLFLADAMIRSGQCKTVLLVAAELYSRMLYPRDFSTFPFFGDGAGAALIAGGGKGDGILLSILKTRGSGNNVIQVPAGGTMMPLDSVENVRDLFFKMDGKAVYAFAVEQGTNIILELLEEAGVSPRDVQCYIPHQANINIIRQIAENIGVPEERFFVNLDQYGNTAGASVLIALDEAVDCRMVQRGDLVLTVAFGGGLSWGANLIVY